MILIIMIIIIIMIIVMMIGACGIWGVLACGMFDWGKAGISSALTDSNHAKQHNSAFLQ